MNEQAAAQALDARHNPPKFATLPMGKLAYFDIGTGKPLLMMHGFPDTPRTFSGQVEAFTAAGYRCLIPYLPGYGKSDSPPGKNFSMLAIGRMMNQFLRQLVPGQPVSIVGHDWGSAIAQAMAALYLEDPSPGYKLDRLAICAVPPLKLFMLTRVSFKQIYRSRYMGYFQLPRAIPEIKRGKLDYIRTLWARWSPGIAQPDPQLEATIATLDEGECLTNAISYYRYVFHPRYVFSTGELIYQLRLLFRAKPLPCLIIVGKNDGCIGLEVFRGSEDCFPHPVTRLMQIPDAGHFVHYEQPEAFNRAVLGFFAGATAA